MSGTTLKDDAVKVPALHFVAAMARAEVPEEAREIALTDFLEGRTLAALSALVDAAREEGRAEVAEAAARMCIRADAIPEEELHGGQ